MTATPQPTMTATPQEPLDLLDCLPNRRVHQFKPGSLIYTPEVINIPATALCIVFHGLVATRVWSAEKKRTLILDVAGRYQGFGTGSRTPLDVAYAVTNCEVVSWTQDELDSACDRKPALHRLLLEEERRRRGKLAARLASFYQSVVTDRLGWGLMSLIEFGEATSAGVALPGLRHHFLADLVATSREIVSGKMAEFRRRGLVQYSRKQILITKAGLAKWGV